RRLRALAYSCSRIAATDRAGLGGTRIGADAVDFRGRHGGPGRRRFRRRVLRHALPGIDRAVSAGLVQFGRRRLRVSGRGVGTARSALVAPTVSEDVWMELMSAGNGRSHVPNKSGIWP